MPTSIDSQSPASAGFVPNSLVLLSALVAYPLAGALLTSLLTGGVPADSDFRWLEGSMLARFRAAQALGQVVVLGLPVFWLARRYSGSARPFSVINLSYLGIGNSGNPLQLFFAAAGMLLLQPFLYSLVEVQNLLLPYLGETGVQMLRENERLELFIRKLAESDSVGGFLMVAGVLVLVPACCEELFFRGFIQKNYGLAFSPNTSVLFTGFVFALFHMEPANFLPLTLLGCYIGYIYMKTDNLAVPVVAHGINNLAALLFLQKGEWPSGAAGVPEGAALLASWYWWGIVLCSSGLFFMLMVRFSGSALPRQNMNDNNA